MVTFFFVLSGFVMYISYSGKIDFLYHEYWVNRLARIFPIYFIALLLVLAIRKFAGIDILSLLLNLSLLHAWFSNYSLSYNVPSWSLSVEVFFYASFPLVLWLLKRYKFSMLRVISYALLIWLFTQVLLILVLSLNPFSLNPVGINHFVYYYPLSHFCSFILGVSGAYCVFEKMDYTRLGKILGYLWIPLVVLVGVILNYQIYLFKNLKFSIPLGSSFWAPLFLMLIMSISVSKGTISRILSFKVLVVLGEASYSLYILQVPIHKAYVRYCAGFLYLNQSLDFYLFTLILILVSLGTFYFIETPGKMVIYSIFGYLRKKTEHRKGVNSATA